MDLTDEKILVSVIMAVYNSEKYLRNTLNSVCVQTLQEIEIICVDDGSVDSSLSILEEYVCLDDRIKILKQWEKSDGAAKARNLGLLHARGKYFSVLDSDDFFEPDMLEKAYRKAVETDADIVIYDGYVFDENTGADKETGFILCAEYLPEGREIFSPKENRDTLFQMTLGASWNCLVKRSYVKNHDICFQSFHHADDLGFVYLAFACARKIAVLKERLVHYRMNNMDSQAANISKWPETSYQALLQLKKELTARGLYEEFKVSFVQAAINYFIFYLENMRDFRAFISLFDSIREKYLKELGILEIFDDQFKNEDWVKYRNAFQNMTAAEYLYRKMMGISPFEFGATWKEKIPAKSRIVIYGAGDAGTDVFCETVREKRYQVRAWLDRQYEKIGFPVESPERIKTLDFDYVVVAVKARELYKAISTYLRECGVHEEKILWIRGG